MCGIGHKGDFTRRHDKSVELEISIENMPSLGFLVHRRSTGLVSEYEGETTSKACGVDG